MGEISKQYNIFSSLRKDFSQLKVRDWMTKSPLSIEVGAAMRDAAVLMDQYNVEELVVVNQKKEVIGRLAAQKVISYLLNKNLQEATVTEETVEPLEILHVEDSITACINLPSISFPVVNMEGKLVGVLTEKNRISASLYLLQTKNHADEALNVILESAYEGVVVVDARGVIQQISRAYKNFLGIREEDVIGRPVTDVIDNTRLHIVVENGIPERGDIQEIQGQNMVVHRIPIWKDNKVVGAIGTLIFEGVTELYKILERINKDNRINNKEALPLKKMNSNRKVMSFEQMIGESKELVSVKSVARRAARTRATVMITGESGTGKEVFARAIHQFSPYADGPFVSVNCAAIPEHLLEAELFGYEEGAFTGARRGGKPGKFELANNGTLFLDEIGDMPLMMQAKILRVLQEKEVERVGGMKKREINVRIIAATNQLLEDMVKKGTFREDLYYRLNIIRIALPPLRERKADIPVLLSHHLEGYCKEYGFSLKQFSKKAIEAFMAYHWPGNVRELVNTVERLVTLVEGEVIQLKDVPHYMLEEKEGSRLELEQMILSEGVSEGSLIEQVKIEGLEYEKQTIMNVLKEVKGNKSQAAKKLGIHRSTLYEKLKKFKLTV